MRVERWELCSFQRFFIGGLSGAIGGYRGSYTTGYTTLGRNYTTSGEVGRGDAVIVAGGGAGAVAQPGVGDEIRHQGFKIGAA
jgi:hypothetical protein